MEVIEPSQTPLQEGSFVVRTGIGALVLLNGKLNIVEQPKASVMVTEYAPAHRLIKLAVTGCDKIGAEGVVHMKV